MRRCRGRRRGPDAALVEGKRQPARRQVLVAQEPGASPGKEASRGEGFRRGAHRGNGMAMCRELMVTNRFSNMPSNSPS